MHPDLPDGVCATLKADWDMSKLREQSSDTDFCIKCKDVSIPVHSLVMKSYWPYFKALSETECLEATDKSVELDYPSSWVQKLVSYLYGEEVGLTFDELTGLMVLGELYQIPELAENASDKILNVDYFHISLEDVISGWRRACQVNNQAVKDHLIELLVSKHREEQEAGTEGLREKYETFDLNEALEMFFNSWGLDQIKKELDSE